MQCVFEQSLCFVLITDTPSATKNHRYICRNATCVRKRAKAAKSLGLATKLRKLAAIEASGRNQGATQVRNLCCEIPCMRAREPALCSAKLCRSVTLVAIAGRDSNGCTLLRVLQPTMHHKCHGNERARCGRMFSATNQRFVNGFQCGAK